MEPTGAGRLRGFRAPGADPAERGAPTLAVPESGPAGSEPSPGPLGRGAGWRWVLAAAGVLVVALLVITALAFRLGSNSATSADRTPTPTPTRSTPTPLPLPEVYRQVVPSVVLITTSKGSLGSGVIVTDTGLVLTANHVISGGGAISILFADGTKAPASVAAADPKTDSATLMPRKLPEVVVAATLGGGVAVGSDVVAVGNPLGLRDSTTTGVVSGLNRTTKTKSGSVSGLIQFDAAVNPGSSGGPLSTPRGWWSASWCRSPTPAVTRPSPASGSPSPSGQHWAGDLDPVRAEVRSCDPSTGSGNIDRLRDHRQAQGTLTG